MNIDGSQPYTTSELMIAAGSREISDGQAVFAGLGIPQLAVALAQRTHAPHVVVLNEARVIDPHLIELGVGNADPRHWYRASYFGTVLALGGLLCQRRGVD